MYILDFALIHVDIQRGCNVDSVTSLKPPTINVESPDTYRSIIYSIINVDVMWPVHVAFTLNLCGCSTWLVNLKPLGINITLGWAGKFHNPRN